MHGALAPTRDAPNFIEWEYVLRKPSQLNKFFDLAMWDDVIEGTLWKRGSGAQVLHLSQAAGRRGRRSMLVSSAAGNLCLRLRAPKNQKAMPTVRIVFSVLTMDQQNHVLWTQDFAPPTRSALRNMTQAGREVMVRDPLFPTAVTAVGQLVAQAVQSSDTVWGFVPPQQLAALTHTPAAAE